jgi:hypothetical protein
MSIRRKNVSAVSQVSPTKLFVLTPYYKLQSFYTIIIIRDCSIRSFFKNHRMDLRYMDWVKPTTLLAVIPVYPCLPRFVRKSAARTFRLIIAVGK